MDVGPRTSIVCSFWCCTGQTTELCFGMYAGAVEVTMEYSTSYSYLGSNVDLDDAGLLTCRSVRRLESQPISLVTVD
jgi:hypothetical protein